MTTDSETGRHFTARRDGGILRLDFSAPDIRNALTPEALLALRTQLERAAADESMRAIVLESRGPVFCAGADLRWLRREIEAAGIGGVVDVALLGDFFAAIRACPVPTIARVQGDAYGGGVPLVASCDFAISAESAGFALSELRFAIQPDVIVTSLRGRVGPAALRRWTLSAERVTARDALAAGLISQVTDDLDGALAALLERISRMPSGAIRDWKRSLAEYDAAAAVIERRDNFSVTHETLAALSQLPGSK